MATNKGLHKAKRNKQDDFYTLLEYIELEIKHYKRYFKNKVILCNCDDPRESNFFHYFSYNFDFLGLKKLITTCYKNQMHIGPDDIEKAVYLEYEGSKNRNGIPSPEEIGIKELRGDGDFRSKECIELLKQADIVVTNPPFSLFREYIAQLMQYKKKFLIMGNLNAITYKEVFPLIKNNQLWLGVTLDGRNIWFRIPDYYKEYKKIEDGIKYAYPKGVVWFTNLPHRKRDEELILVKKYKGNEKDYPKYDNYNAIEVSKVINIPKDYKGAMGVPITFLNKYNPKQFELIWTTDRGGDGILEHLKLPHTRYDAPVINDKGIYKRILIRRK
jgi:hypothetical protein